jgi:SAM-dependent methyltransferase
MDLPGWNERYLDEQTQAAPTPLLTEIVRGLHGGRALDLACGSGRNALWLAQHGWDVTAVDGSPAAIESLRRRAEMSGVRIRTETADLEAHEFIIQPDSWDLIAICFYLQRDLFEPAKLGVVPGGVLLAIVHITEPGEEPTKHRLRPGELARYFDGWEILHSFEGTPHDSAHHRASAEIAARKPRRG